MNIEFAKHIEWTPALEGVVTWAIVDGKRVGCVLEGRVLAKHFGAEDEPYAIEIAYQRNRDFLEGIIRDAIERGMIDDWGELLLGEDELMPYLEKHTPTAATAPA